MQFCAHYRRDGTPHSLFLHVRTVSQYCSQFAAAAGMAACGKLIGLLHDMGKATAAFAEYLLFCFAHPGDFSRRGSVVHSAQGAVYLFKRFGGGDFFERLTASFLAMVIGAHHGILPDCVSLDGRQPLYEKLCDPALTAGLEEAEGNFFGNEISEAECEALFCEAVGEVRRFWRETARTDDPIWLAHLGRFLLSCLTRADCLDTAEFMEGLPASADPAPTPPEDFWETQAAMLDRSLDAPAPDSITAIRQGIYGQCRDMCTRAPDLYELYVPTGGGKTFSSMRFALGHAAEHGKKRVIYVIPYLSILEQNADSLRERLSCAIQEFHSGVLPEAGDPDAQPEYAELFDAPVVLTTMVQFLDAFFSGRRGALRRMHQFCDAVLIFDEIQSLPLNCIHLFNSAIDFLRAACNTTVVLCSATQPLLHRTAARPLNQGRAPVPMIADGGALFSALKRTRVLLAPLPFRCTLAELKKFIMEKLAETGGVLTILNTKRDALLLFCALKEAAPAGVKLFHLSTAMCPEHRRDILKKVRHAVDARERFVCVSTQLIEAGVDLSSPCVIRALAGADSVAQAAGRCNRNGEADCRDVYIVRLQQENLSRLPDIASGQEATERVLRWSDDLLSRSAMDRYYELYFMRNAARMSYPLPGGARNLYDLLSKNIAGRSALGRTPALPLPQAFAEAAEHFMVIDRDTETVLVPYGGGAALIEALTAARSAGQVKALLAQAQQYGVSLFAWQKRRLGELGALHETPQGILYVDAAYYDEDTGLIMDEQPMPFLFH